MWISGPHMLPCFLHGLLPTPKPLRPARHHQKAKSTQALPTGSPHLLEGLLCQAETSAPGPVSRCFSAGCFRELCPLPGLRPDAHSRWSGRDQGKRPTGCTLREPRPQHRAYPGQKHARGNAPSSDRRAPPRPLHNQVLMLELLAEGHRLQCLGALAPTHQAMLNKSQLASFPNSALNPQSGSGKRTDTMKTKRTALGKLSW